MEQVFTQLATEEEDTDKQELTPSLVNKLIKKELKTSLQEVICPQIDNLISEVV